MPQVEIGDKTRPPLPELNHRAFLALSAAINRLHITIDCLTEGIEAKSKGEPEAPDSPTPSVANFHQGIGENLMHLTEHVDAARERIQDMFY